MSIGHVNHYSLNGCEPNGQGACSFLNQDAYETLQTAHNGPVQQDRTVTCAVFTHILSPQTFRHEKINLNGSTLPWPPDGIFQGVFNFGTIKSAFAGRHLILAARSTQTFHQSMFCLVPTGITANALVGARGNFVDDVFETKISIDLLQQGGVIRALLQNLIFGAKNVTIVLREPTHTHDAVQSA